MMGRLGSRVLVLPVLFVLGVSAVGACSPDPPKPPDLPQKKQLVSDSDPDRVRVTMIKDESAPLTVDWNFEHRKGLETRVKRGTVIVSFTQKKLSVLSDCSAPGRYEFVGTSPGRSFAAAHNAAELEANFPFSAASLRGRLAQEGSLLADLRIVGSSNLDLPRVARGDLRGGACAEATHYVVEVTHGGFVFGAESAIEAAAKGGFMGIGAGGAVASSGKNLEQEGSLADCENANADAKAPPGRCAGILRIRMVPLEKADAAPDARPQVQTVATKPSCGDGLRWNGASCVSEARVVAEAPKSEANAKVAPTPAPEGVSAANPKGYACSGQDPQECARQCKAGNAESCAITGTFFEAGTGGAPKDFAVAEQLYALACKAGALTGCMFQGALYLGQKRYAPALEASKKACDGGDAGGCTNLGFQLYNGLGVTKDRPRAYDLYARACKRREFVACNNAGVMVMFATGGVAADPPTACKMFENACTATSTYGCGNLGICLEHGIGRAADPNKALERYMGECEKGFAFGCVWGGLLFEQKSQDPQAVSKALKAYEAGCGFENPGYCVATNEIMTALPARYSLDMIDRRACDGGDQRGLACYNAAIVHERGAPGVPKNLSRANLLLKLACNKYDMKKACRPAGI